MTASRQPPPGGPPAGRLPQARQALAQAFAQAQALHRAGRFPEAETSYRRLLEAQPGDPQLLNLLGLVARQRGNLAEAEQFLRQAIAATPREAVFHNNLGNVLGARGDIAAAESCYRSALALNPAYPDAYYNLGLSLQLLGRNDEALTALRQAVTRKPDFAEAQTQLGVALRDRGELAEALAHLDKAVAAQPGFYDAHYYRGGVLARLKRVPEALAALQQAAALRPAGYEAPLSMGNVLRDAGREEEALAAYMRAIEVKPDALPVHYEYNQLAWTMGRKDLYLRSYAHARARLGDKPELLLAEAGALVQTGQPAEAERLLRRAHEVAPEHGTVAAALGRVLAGQSKITESFPFFAAAIKAEPQSAAHRQGFGLTLLQGGEAHEALRLLDEAHALDPNNQLTLACLGLAYRELGDSRYQVLVDLEHHIRVYDIDIPPGFADAAAFNAGLAEELERLHTRKVEPFDQTLRGGTQTMGSLFGAPSRAIALVRDSISEAVADYIRSLPDNSAHPLSARKQAEFTYSGSWSCRLRSSGFHTNHVHPKGWISSAYYVHVPGAVEDEGARQGWLKFGESSLSLGAADYPEHHVKPIVGRLVLFPSYYWHGTVPFTSADNRLTIAFDVVPGVVASANLPRGAY